MWKKERGISLEVHWWWVSRSTVIQRWHQCLFYFCYFFRLPISFSRLFSLLFCDFFRYILRHLCDFFRDFFHVINKIVCHWEKSKPAKSKLANNKTSRTWLPLGVLAAMGVSQELMWAYPVNTEITRLNPFQNRFWLAKRKSPKRKRGIYLVWPICWFLRLHQISYTILITKVSGNRHRRH